MLLQGWCLTAFVLLIQLPAVDDPAAVPSVADPVAIDQEASAAVVETEPVPPSTLAEEPPVNFDPNAAPTEPPEPDTIPRASLSTQPVESAEPSQSSTASGAPLAPIDRTRRQALPELLSQAMTAAAASGLPGRPISLVEALTAIKNRDTDSRRQLIRAYWQLATAMLDYQFRQTDLRTLERLVNDQSSSTPDQTAAAELKAAFASAEEEQSRARTAIATAQAGVAVLLAPPLADQVILASDAPHAGIYRTRFEQLFQGRQAPSQSWLLNRILPLRHDEIQARGRAIAAAEYAVAASAEQCHAGQAGLPQLLHDMALLASIRRTLVSSLEQYNYEIADYVLAAKFTSGDQELVAMLIKPRAVPATPGTMPAAANVDEVKQAGFDETPKVEPKLPTAEEPDPQPPAETSANRAATGAGQPLAVIPGDPADDVTEALLADTQVYQGLVGMEQNRQAQQLVSALYLHHHSTGAEQSLSLLDLLQSPIAVGGSRLALIANYWQACEFAARQHVLDNAVVQLKSLTPIALSARADPDGTSQMLVLRAAIAAAEADMLATEIALAGAQWQLMLGLGRPLDQPWLLPVTAPHAGRYRTKIDLAKAPTRLREISGQLDEMHRQMVQGTNSIIELDAARSAATASYATTRQDLRTVLANTARELNETLALLSSVTRYNDAIADFALAVLPQNTPAPLVISALIHVRPNVGGKG